MTDLPMLAIPSTGASGRHPIRLEDLAAKGWWFDTKLDGVRAFGRHGRLVNREGVDITHRYPEVEVPDDHWLDGEIVALDGTFETTLKRDQQSAPARIRRLADEAPCRFIAFDMLDEHLIDRAWKHRRIALEHLSVNSDLAITPGSWDADFFEQVKALKMEGVIAKRPESRYYLDGRRSHDWVKFKVLHRITAVAVGYTLGTGQRSHFGALKLALVGPEGPTAGPGEGWRVGSGFKDRDIDMLKRRLDAGDLFAVEVEVTARSKDGGLRFPVYKGIRTDVPVHTCLVDQLDTLPTY